MADDIKLVTEEADYQKVAEEMAKSISKMYEDMDKKATNGLDHIHESIKVISKKYRTANGVMAVLDCVRDVFNKPSKKRTIEWEIKTAQRIANEMSELAYSMAFTVIDYDPEVDDLRILCDVYYDDSFSEKANIDGFILVKELMILQLCQQISPMLGDLTDFCRSAQKEIDLAKGKLESYCKEHDIDFNELCGPHEDCYDCLCCECVKDCKEDKQIKDGQSAYDVCDNFEAKEE